MGAASLTTAAVRRPPVLALLWFFLHFNSDFPIATLPGCVGPDHPDRYPDAILADDYLRQRLREIKLLY